MGASTGGPTLIKDLLLELKSLSSTIIIVQHMQENVIPFFISDLKESLKVNVQTTPVGCAFEKPSIIICKHSSVLSKQGNRFALISEQEGEQYTPDINKLFASFEAYLENFDLSVLIMTGIGSDGVAAGARLHTKGVKVFAQDEQSSPVYGMPKAAYEASIVDKVMSLEDIQAYIEGL